MKFIHCQTKISPFIGLGHNKYGTKRHFPWHPKKLIHSTHVYVAPLMGYTSITGIS